MLIRSYLYSFAFFSVTAVIAILGAPFALGGHRGVMIVVTSAYHMPRSMLELSHAMPDIRLIPYPVTRPGLTLGDWSEDRGVIVLLLQEYLKYTATRLRLSLGGIEGLADVIGGAFD